MKKKIMIAVLVFAMFVSAHGFYIDLQNTRDYFAIDLRNRVVGARLIENGIDPYFFKWNDSYPEELLDPRDDYSVVVSRVTVPPTVLFLYSFIRDLPYSSQKYLWLFLQWMALIISTWLLARKAGSSNKCMIVWIIGLLVVSGNLMWRFHVERGQLYIFYVLLFAISYYLFDSKSKRKEMISGLIIGFTAALRPTAILMVIPALSLRKYRFVVSTLIGCMSTVGVTMLTHGVSSWKSFLSAMSIHGLVHIGAIERLGVRLSKSTVEGIAWNGPNGLFPFPDIDSSFQELFSLCGFQIEQTYLLLLLGVLCCSIYLYCRNINEPIPNHLYFLIGVLLVLLAEYLLPAARFPYNDVFWLLPLSIIVRGSDAVKPTSLVILSLIILSSFSWAIKYYMDLICSCTMPSMSAIVGLTYLAEVTMPIIMVWVAWIMVKSHQNQSELRV